MKKQLIIIFIIFQSFLFSQKVKQYNYTEKIALISNSDTFITGEKLLYSILCFDASNKPTQLSKIAYVKCIDANNNEIFFNKHYLNNGNDDGYYFIPLELKTGKYRIIAYTKWMLNENYSNYFEKEIFIINPFKKALKNNETLFEEYEVSTDSTKENLITKQYKKREGVTYTSVNSEFDGMFTISVRKTNEIDNKNPKNTTTTTPITDKIKKIILPEIKGELVSGKIITKDSQLPIPEISVALTDKGNIDYLNVTTTDKNGAFNFVLPHALNSESVYIEAVTSSKDYTIVLDSKIEPTLKKDTIENPIQLKPNYEVEIKKRAIAAQIENAYFEIKKDSILPPFKEKTINITYSNVFYLDNLTRFSSLKEFIIEVPNKVYFTDKDDDFKIHFRDGETNFEINEDPLIMVDGMLINNSNDLLKVDFKKIATIATYNQPYYFGNKLYGGLFIVKTIDKGFNEASNEENKVKVAYKIPLENVKNYFPNYINETSLNRIPDYRIQLFWQTNCTSLKNPFQFFTSDVEGTYEISIQGFTNNGDYINEKSLFKVL